MALGKIALPRTNMTANLKRHDFGRTVELQEIARRKLRMLNNSISLSDLRIAPSNRLERGSEKLKEFYSIRINDEWRIIFKWNKNNSTEVEMIDHH